MAAKDAPRKCAHEACECQVKPGSKYCSEYCAKAGGMIELHCNCQHPDCK